MASAAADDHLRGCFFLCLSDARRPSRADPSVAGTTSGWVGCAWAPGAGAGCGSATSDPTPTTAWGDSVRGAGEIVTIVGPPGTSGRDTTMVGSPRPIVSGPVDELKAYVKSEIVRWGEVVKRAGAAGSQ